MSDELNEEQQFVEVYGENGEILRFEIYDIIEFENKTYALLVPYGEEDDDTEVIVMEYVEKDENNAFFRDIEDDEERARVYEYIQSSDDEFFDEDEDI